MSDTLHGWAAFKAREPLVLTELPLKTFNDDDVEMDITHCGICGSDVHIVDCDWGPTDFPCVTGHEIVGVCTKVGKNVKNIKVGDRLGVGAQCDSCGQCEECKRGEENICQGHKIFTIASKYPNGEKVSGGFADKWRGNQKFAIKIPDGMSSEIASTFLCAGITTYAPLVNHRVTKGSKLGVLGLGGLGHYAVLWGKALGAEVVALSSSDKKRDDAKALGCDAYVDTSNKEELERHKNSFTHIIATYLSNNFDWGSYFELLKPDGIFIVVGLPDSPISGIPAMPLVSRQITVVGSAIGPPRMIEEMLQFAHKNNVKPWITKYPMKNINEAFDDFRAGKPRYRFVMEN
ncbi:chaperonin 10-like protein [Pilobolus umbonatus]|nr:chaperonin 10-like protein [Pilobolus umbonatus]